MAGVIVHMLYNLHTSEVYESRVPTTQGHDSKLGGTEARFEA